MTLRASDYRVQQLLHGDGSPVIHPGTGLQIWVTRCGNEVTGTRTDGLPANMHPAVFLGTQEKTVAVRPPAEEPGGESGQLGPGGILQPVGGGFASGGAGRGPDPGIQSPSGGGRVLLEDREVWVVKPCTRSPGPPLGPFPTGMHLAAPLGAQLDTPQGPLPVFADGCVECEAPIPPCGSCQFCWPTNSPRVWEFEGANFAGECSSFNGRHRLFVLQGSACIWFGNPSDPRYAFVFRVEPNSINGRAQGVFITYNVDNPSRQIVYTSTTGQAFNCCGETTLEQQQNTIGCAAPPTVLIRPEGGRCECPSPQPPPTCCPVGLTPNRIRVIITNSQNPQSPCFPCIDGWSVVLPRNPNPPGLWEYRKRLLPSDYTCGFFGDNDTMGFGCGTPTDRYRFDYSLVLGCTERIFSEGFPNDGTLINTIIRQGQFAFEVIEHGFIGSCDPFFFQYRWTRLSHTTLQPFCGFSGPHLCQTVVTIIPEP